MRKRNPIGPHANLTCSMASEEPRYPSRITIRHQPENIILDAFNPDFPRRTAVIHVGNKLFYMIGLPGETVPYGTLFVTTSGLGHDGDWAHYRIWGTSVVFTALRRKRVRDFLNYTAIFDKV